MSRWTRTLLLVALLWLAGCDRGVPADNDPVPRPTGSDQQPVTAQQPAPTASAFSVAVPLARSGDSQTRQDTGRSEGPYPGPAASATSPPTTATASPTPAATPTPAFPVYRGPALDPARLGVQIHLHREDLNQLMTHLKTLGVGWVKVQVSWKIYQPEPERYDWDRLAELDALIAAAEGANIRVMLGVAKAPEWSRPTTTLDGPPIDNGRFQSFMAWLAERYRGRVAAYELWNEPNLAREWTGMALNAAALVDLIRAGAAGVRLADPDAVIISAAPATTGINDGVSAIDDRLYLQQMLAADVAEVVDAVGAHPYGWANPPDSSAAAPDPAVPSHNNHPSFFFSDTLTDYRALLVAAGHPNLPIWVTEFGWGSYDGMQAAVPEAVAYMAHVNEQQQAVYILKAYQLAQEWAGIGPLILWNLNFAPTFGTAFPESAYSLLRPDGSPRPAYHALGTLTDPPNE
ncbi:MAG: cellulase family glycosylhydrolase [Candidatus Promineifilaceae bacterium]|nr:cellulase family glycosylhydrolase [Candidatus Promineifilaceae bacterium]